MDPAQPFLDAIFDDPDNDSLYLMFADWLEERGDPRGEFIRLQCAYRTMDRKDKGYADLVCRSADLLSANKEHWLLKAWQDEPNFFTFFRGFISLDVDAANLRSGAIRQQLASEAGRYVFEISFHDDMDEPTGAFFKLLELQRIVSLRFGHEAGVGSWNDRFSRFSVQGMQKLAKSPLLNGLRILDLSKTQSDDRTMKILAHSPVFSCLKRINLAKTQITDRGLLALAQSQHFPNLKTIQVSKPLPGPEAEQALLVRFGPSCLQKQ